jgi:hypothetical protein
MVNGGLLMSTSLNGQTACQERGEVGKPAATPIGRSASKHAASVADQESGRNRRSRLNYSDVIDV